ncbi:MAG: hypothetical protein AB7D51_06660 [Desulfovibrionaceae bacterium]
MDGYKRTILAGCVFVLGAYLLPWFSTLAQDISGLGLLGSGVDAVRTMRALGHWDAPILTGYAAVALPLAAALFSMLYCLARPTGQNGRFGSVLFLLPGVVLALAWVYFGLANFSFTPGSGFLAPLGAMILDDALDLARTGGLWALHLGAGLMLLGRYTR